jgi:hypothetical protein
MRRLFLIAAVLIWANKAQAETLYVRSGDYSSIQSAIDDANDGDVVIVDPNRYIENLTFNGKNIEVRSTDPNDWAVVEQTIIDGNGVDTVVLFESGEDANCILRGFTITDGNASSGYGGGIRIRNYSGPTILNNLITNNSAEKGAGICLYHSFSRVFGNVIVNNRGTEYGQGGGMMIIDCFENTNAVIANNIIVGNQTVYGGGIRIQNSTAEIVNNVIAYNRAVWRGIGIYGEGDAIVNCIVWGHGGSVHDNLYQCTATYSCIERNTPGVGNISSDPCFADAGYWDDANTPADANDDFFVTGDYHLMPQSLCVDAGNNNSVPAAVTTDFDGDPRVINTVVDIGADEFRVTIAADFNSDGIVDYADLFVLVDEWLKSAPSLQSDFDKNGFVDLYDYSAFSQNWGLWY